MWKDWSILSWIQPYSETIHPATLNLLRQVPRAVQYHRDASPLKRCSKTKKLFLSLINVGNVQRRYIEVQINGVWCIIDIYMVK